MVLTKIGRGVYNGRIMILFSMIVTFILTLYLLYPLEVSLWLSQLLYEFEREEVEEEEAELVREYAVILADQALQEKLAEEIALLPPEIRIELDAELRRLKWELVRAA